jgi:hypothetical protein
MNADGLQREADLRLVRELGADGFTLLTTVVSVVIYLVVDLLYPLLNPQTRS